MRKAILVCALAGTGTLLFAQGPRTPIDGSAQDALLAEVRALRGEINRVASAGVRTQLLVARLQLQEQRVLAVARQLADTQNALTTVVGRISSERARVRQLEDTASRAAIQTRQSFQHAILDAGTQIEQLQKQEAQWRDREKELQRNLSEAQARWTDFNDRLDALERGLPGGASE